MAALGLVGMDPTVAVLAAASVVAGVRGRTVAAFLVTVLLGSWVFGSILALTVGRLVPDPAVLHAVRISWYRGAVEAVVAVAAVVWLTTRLIRGRRPAKERGLSETRVIGAVGVGALIVVGWLFDPGFVGAVIVAGAAPPIVVVPGMLLWLLPAQSPTIVVAAAMLSGRHGASPSASTRSDTGWHRCNGYWSTS